MDANYLSTRFPMGEMVNRDRLVSAMLQDRGVLRVISAPHGFGKSTLAAQYAQRLFPPSGVVWVDASSPEFIQALDRGLPYPRSHSDKEVPRLLILDDLPLLEEPRLSKLSNHIDMLMFQGGEVIVTNLPSNDSIGSVQPDRILIGAMDLLVTEREALSGSLDTVAKVRAKESFNQKKGRLMGTVPALYWDDDPDGNPCLDALFQEKLTLEVLSCLFAMLLMGRGSIDDLERIGVRPAGDEESLIIRNYPFMGINPIQRDFAVGTFSLPALERSIAASPMQGALSGGSFPLPERVVSVLMDRGETERAGEILELFCTDERCEEWLLQSGWELVDQTEIALIETLMARCAPAHIAGDASLSALNAWVRGLSGDEVEAVHFAQKSLRICAARTCPPDESDLTALAAYLAQLAFGEGNVLIHQRPTFASQQVITHLDFLASVVDLCTDVEIERALTLRPSVRGRELEQLRKDAEHDRAEALFMLATQYADRFEGTLGLRMALHIIQHVDDGRLREMVREMGCSVMVTCRRQGVRTVSEALLVGDLWRCGAFGVGTRASDFRDGRVLDAAAAMFGKVGTLAGKDPLPIPWETNRTPDLGEIAEGGLLKNRRTRQVQHIPTVTLRLFGCFELLIDDKLVVEADWKRRAKQLFIILALYQGRDVTRDFIYNQLWPGMDRTHAKSNFYVAWKQMSDMLGEGPYVERNGDFCRINKRYVSSDVAEFESLVRRLLSEKNDVTVLLDIYARLESLYRGGLVPSETENGFILYQRDNYQDMFIEAMVSASARALEAHDARVALWFARKAMEQDSRREDVYNAKIRAQIAAGQRCGAIRTFFDCRAFLREELGLDPGAETQELYEKLICSDPELATLTPESFRR